MTFPAGWYDVELRARERTDPSIWTFVNRLIARVYVTGVTPRTESGPRGLTVGDRVEISYVHLYDTPVNPASPREPNARLSVGLAPGSFLGVATNRRNAEPKLTPPSGAAAGRVLLDLTASSLGTEGSGGEVVHPGAIDHAYFVLRVASPLNPTGAAKDDTWEARTPTLWVTLRADNILSRVLGFETLAVLSARIATALELSGAPTEFGGVELLEAPSGAPAGYPFRVRSADAPLRDVLDRLRPGRPHSAFVRQQAPRGYDPTRVPAILSQPDSALTRSLVTASDPERRWLPLTRFDRTFVSVFAPTPAIAHGGVWTFAVLVACPDWTAPRERPGESDEQPATLTPPALRPYGLCPRFDAGPGTTFESVLSARELALPWTYLRYDTARPPSRWSLIVRFRSTVDVYEDGPPTDLRAWWNARVCRSIQAALRSVRDSATASFLPTLRDPRGIDWPTAESPTPPDFLLRYPVIELAPLRSMKRPSYLLDHPTLAALAPFSETLDAIEDRAPRAAPPEFDVVAEFEGAPQGVDARPLQKRYRVKVEQDLSREGEVPDLLWTFKPVPRPANQLPVESRLRVGSIELVVDDEPVAHSAATVKRLGFRDESLSVGGSDVGGADFLIRVLRFDPCGEDIPQARDAKSSTEADDSPLRLVVAEPIAGQILADLGLFLRVREAFGARQDHSLRLSIERAATPPPPESWPRISAVIMSARPLEVARVTTRLSLESAQVALWSRDASGRSTWKLSVDPRFHLTLPPQAVVEDTVDTVSAAPSLPFRVAFGPAMQVDLLSTGRARRMNLAPWNLQDLLADPEDEIPGAWIQTLRTEILFGLRVRNLALDHHLAELDASLGRVPTVPSAEDLALTSRATGTLPEREFRAYSEDLKARRSSLRDRLRWYELVSRLNPGAPVDSVAVTPSLRDSQITPRGSPLDEWRVKGGALWGVKSRAIREQAEGDLVATGALEAPAFTPLGGFGRQIASFNGGLSKIYATVRMGRVLDYKFERRGRIAILGHPARYVVIYRRYAAREGDPLAGVAALRKVEEYVEFEAPLRSYPDAGRDARHAGPLASAHFAQGRRVRVDASRGWDSPVGWVLPLTSGGEDPTLVLSFLDVDGKRVESGISNPEILNFFSATSPDANPDPSMWPWYSDIDGPAAELAEPTPVPGALRPGVERFTFHLTKTPRVDIVARRFAAPVEVALENVTLARALWDDNGTTGREVSSLLRSSLDDLARRVVGDQTASAPEKVAAELRGALGVLAKNAHPLPTRIRESRRQFIESCFADLRAMAAELRADAADAVDRVRALIEQRARRCLAIDQRRTLVDAAERALAEISREIAAERAAIEALAAGVSEAQLRRAAAALVVSVQRWIAKLARHIGHVGAEAVSPIVLAVQRFGAELVNRLKGVFDQGGADLRGRLVASVRTELDALRATLEGAAAPYLAVRAWITEQERVWRERVGDVSSEVVNKVCALVVTHTSIAKEALEGALAEVSTRIDTAAAQAAEAVAGHLAVLDGALDTLVERARVYARNASQILAAFESLAGAGSDLRRELERALSDAVTSIPRAVGDLALDAYRVALQDVGRKVGADTGLGLLRAFGAAPEADTLEFVRGNVVINRLEYLFKDEIRTTVVDAIANARSALAAVDLPAFNLRLPVAGIGEQLIPKIPADFNLTRLLPRIAGLDLATILGQSAPGLGGGLDKVVSLKHGFDRIERRAWLHASLDTHRDEPTKNALDSIEFLDAGGITIHLEKVRIEAAAEVSTDLSGRVVQRTTSSVGANWDLRFAGTPVLTLVETSLRVDGDGCVSFAVPPEKIKVPEALNFLNELLASIGRNDGSGLSLSVRPEGVALRYGIALPALQTGAFSISGVSLQASLTLGLQGGVSLDIGAGVSTRERPFVLAVLFLGGGGWFEIGVRKAFTGRDLDPKPWLDLGIAVGASVPFDIGVARGGVQFLVYASLQWSGGSGVAITIGASLRGELEILGIISVGVYVSLEVTYQSGGTLTLRGRLQVKIKVFFFSVTVSTGFSKTLAGSARADDSRALEAPQPDPVDEYLKDFAGYARTPGAV